MLTCGRPIGILPPRGARALLLRILVALNGGPEATRAVASAMPLLLHAGAVEVLTALSEATVPVLMCR